VSRADGRKPGNQKTGTATHRGHDLRNRFNTIPSSAALRLPLESFGASTHHPDCCVIYGSIRYWAVPGDALVFVFYLSFHPSPTTPPARPGWWLSVATTTRRGTAYDYLGEVIRLVTSRLI